MKKAAILAAGEGSRMKEINSFKSIVKINGTPILELTLKNLFSHDFNQVCIIFNETHQSLDLSSLPSLKNKEIDYFFRSTPSSMHSLYEVGLRLELDASKNEHFFVSMVDSIISPQDARHFHQFCQSIKEDESAILVTSFIEDEKPLTLKIDQEGTITEFQCAISEGVLITSGVYYFSSQVLPLLEKMIQEGHSKMRNFLTELVLQHHKIKVYQVAKTLDIDRPEDIQSAQTFLQEQA